MNNEMTLKRRIKHMITIILFYLFRVFKIKKNKIVCVSYHGRGYGDSEKYIIDELLKLNNKLDIVWSINDSVDTTSFPKQIRFVKIYSIKWIYELATAKVWLNNSRFEYYIKKRKDQYYIQTWHGSIPLKKIEYDAIDNLSKYYEKSMRNDSEMTNLAISNSRFCTELYKRAFKYNCEILEIGTPRNDVLLNNNYLEYNNRIKDYYKIGQNKKVLLYAPTFRNDYSNNPYNIDFNKVKKELDTKYKKEWIILIRLHPNIKDPSKLIDYNENIINASNYPDMQELLIGCDILVTDYSSSMFDAIILDKPVFLYTNDLEEYVSKERGFNFELQKLPFLLAKDEKELEDKILSFDELKMQEKYNQFKDEIGLSETGKSSKEVAKIILEKCTK